MTDLKNKILEMVAKDLQEIETALEKNLNPYLDLVSKIARHILFSGGKRLRPLLSVLSARICGYNGRQDKTISIIFEYLHAATLLHDDLVDDATLRRGQPVAHSIWGNPSAILVGDFLLARSLSIAAKTENPKIIKIIAGITENMSQGEIHQLMKKGYIHLSETEYMEVIRRKTAVLFKGACQASALMANASHEMETALASYGYHLGMAFQMADDLLDYTLDTRLLGKNVGTDLREGKLTLPVIHSLKNADKKDRSLMEQLIKSTTFTNDEFKKLIKLLQKYGGVTYTQKKAADFISIAKQSLSVFESSKTKETLIDIADYALSRST